MKLFTLDERFVLRKAGWLDEPDRTAVQRSLKLLLSLQQAARYVGQMTQPFRPRGQPRE